MNKTEVIRKVSALSGISTEISEKVIYSLEEVLADELSNSKGKASAFDKVYNILTFIRNKKNNK